MAICQDCTRPISTPMNALCAEDDISVERIDPISQNKQSDQGNGRATHVPGGFLLADTMHSSEVCKAEYCCFHTASIAKVLRSLIIHSLPCQ